MISLPSRGKKGEPEVPNRDGRAIAAKNGQPFVCSRAGRGGNPRIDDDKKGVTPAWRDNGREGKEEDVFFTVSNPLRAGYRACNIKLSAKKKGRRCSEHERCKSGRLRGRCDKRRQEKREIKVAAQGRPKISRSKLEKGEGGFEEN